jgi:hypothetical protein
MFSRSRKLDYTIAEELTSTHARRPVLTGYAALVW